MEPAPVSSWSPSPRSTDSSPAPISLKRLRENGQEADPEVEPAPKKAFGFEMKLNTNMVSWKLLSLLPILGPVEKFLFRVVVGWGGVGWW